MAIDKSEIISDVWTYFKDRLESEVTTVTLSDSSTQTIKTYSNTIPDKLANARSAYPILIVNSPEISWDEFTLTKKWAMGSITIDIFTTKHEASDLFADAIIDAIETYRSTLSGLNLINVSLDSTSKDEYFLGQIKIHNKSITFIWRFAFTKT